MNLCDDKITKKRTSEDSYEIFVNGQSIGSVYKGWHRLGGSGWLISNRFQWGAYKTIKQAITAMYRETFIN